MEQGVGAKPASPFFRRMGIFVTAWTYEDFCDGVDVWGFSSRRGRVGIFVTAWTCGDFRHGVDVWGFL
jgi:hypothetical protein